MADAVHTPGPWVVKKSPSHNGYGVSIAEDDPTVSISVFAAYGPHEQERRETALANARLIAASPDLYEALDQILDDMRDGLSVCQDTKDQARAALLKAGS